MPIEPVQPISMRDFLRTGHLGPVRLGDSTDKLREVFGEPTDIGFTWVKGRRIPAIWMYGDIEFHFNTLTKRVWLVFCDTFDALKLIPGVSFDRWFFAGKPQVSDVEAQLLAAAFVLGRRECKSDSNLSFLCLESGVELLICNYVEPGTYPGAPGVYGFQLSDKSLQ